MATWPSREFLEIESPKFSPYIFVKTSRDFPTSIAMAAAGGWSSKTINLPSDTTAGDLPDVQEIVRKHFERSRGGIPLWEKIEGYLFVYAPTEGIVLDVEGNEIGRRTGRYHPPSIEIQKGL